MIAYMIVTCAKGIVYTGSRGLAKVSGGGGLLEQDAGPLDLLAAERAQEVRHEAVHQLEIGRKRGRILLRVVEDLFPVALRVHGCTGPAVNEDELRAQHEPFALHVRAGGDDATPAE